MTKQIQMDMRGIMMFMLFMEACACSVPACGLVALEIFMEAIADSEEVDVERPFFVRSSDINYLLENTPGEMSKWTFAQVQQLVRQGMLDGFDRKFDRIPKGYEGVPRWRGILHGDRGTGASMEVQVLERKQGRTFKVMGNITLLGSGANGKED